LLGSEIVLAASNTSLSLSPLTQSVSSGSNISINVNYSAGESSVKTVQSVLSYNPEDFTFISATPVAPFNAAFPFSSKIGSVTFTAGSKVAVNSDQTIANIVLRAIGREEVQQ